MEPFKGGVIEVKLKEGMLDVLGLGIKSDIEGSGVQGVTEVKVSSLYKISGDINAEGLEEIARKVLADKVSEQFDLYRESSPPEGIEAVEVWYRQGVTDTVSETAEKAIKDAGFSIDFSVESGKKYYIKGMLAEGDLRAICEKVLSNPLIQEYKII